MNLTKLLHRETGCLVAVITLIIIFVAPSLISAAQVTERSIELSSSSVSADNVTYGVTFTSVGAASAFVIDFCTNSPLIGQECTTPAGFDVAEAEATTTGFTDEYAIDGNTIRVSGTVAPTTVIAVNITGITNPSAAGALYARIITYDTASNADQYQSNDLGAGAVDTGTVAIAITPTIGVSGSVLESMTFCVAKNAIAANCNLAGNQPPSLKLGEEIGDSTVLTTEVSEGMMYSQISTNAFAGAVISLKSNASGCGGLIRAGATSACNILPALTGGISAGEAKFGVKVAPAADAGVNPTGTLRAVNNYNNASFTLNYTPGDTAGVTSTYGDPFFDTNGGPANGKNMLLTFGAAISTDTPAGSYSANLSLVATGKF